METRESEGLDLTWHCCNMRLLEMPLIGHVSVYSIKTEEGDGVPDPSSGFSPAAAGALWQEGKGSEVAWQMGPAPRVWFGEELRGT